MAKFGKKELHPLWRGNDTSYQKKHEWIRSNYGSANKCENCSVPHRIYDWASVDEKYTRDIKDYIQLCRACHVKWDKGLITIRGIKKITKEFHGVSFAKNMKKWRAYIEMDKKMKTIGYFLLKSDAVSARKAVVESL